ncbi:MAG TPA: VCBS repeat-containing protein [Verrucomicrobiota bacterium]|nr:VCBS repeat-containing protein [Verrucomicrobiota bacterium]
MFNSLFLKAGLVGGLILVAGLALPSSAQTNEPRFGFTGPEIFPIDNQIGLIHAADLDGDGLNDIVVVNNNRSKINLLYNQTGKTNISQSPAVKRELNELPPDARFRIDSIASEKRIAALALTDLNSDARPDIAYYGEPKELVVLYNQGTNEWSAPKRWPIDDALLTQNALTRGDLNGDGRTDLVLLGENRIYILFQREDGTLADPEKIPVSSAVKSVLALDIDGDERDDLLLVNWDSPTPFRFRLQDAGGRLGPEIYFKLPPIRSYWADNFERGEKTFVVTIAQNSGRAQIADFERKPAETLSGGFRQGQFQVLPLDRTDKSRRGLLWADADGDGRADLLVAEPESGQITVYLQLPDGSLGQPKRFSTLAGVTDIAVADWDGDGKPEIFLLSADERQVGVTRFDENKRLPFPTLVSLEGRPLAITVAALKPDTKPALVVITDQDGKRSLVTRTADGKTSTRRLGENFKSNPSRLETVDVNQDGLEDVVILIPYEKVKVLLQGDGGEFDEQDVALPGGSLEQPWLAVADVNGDGKPELLLPQKNFLRAVVLERETVADGSTNKAAWTFTVKEQINGATSTSRLTGAAAVPQGTNAIPSLFLLDADRKVLTLSERDAAGVWQVVKNIELPVTDFSTIGSVALGASTPNTVTFRGNNAVAWLSLSGDVWEYTPVDGYETPIKDGYLTDVISGDLDNDGRKDLVFLETAKNHLDLVIFDFNHKLIPADRWQVFEQRTYRGRGADRPEPREAIVADFNGDGKNDLAVIVHDRVLVYPQE